MKIILVQSKFLVKFCLIFFVTNISNIDRHSSIHQNKASWWILCVKYLQISQILIITSGENYWILNWFWSSPKQSPHKKGSTDKRGKLNCFMFKVRWCLTYLLMCRIFPGIFYALLTWQEKFPRMINPMLSLKRMCPEVGKCFKMPH